MLGKKLIKTGTIGADTTFLIDFFKEEKKAVEFMRKNAKLIRVSDLVVYEFLCGNLNEKQKQLFLEAIQSFVSVNFNRESSIISSEMYRKSKTDGKEIGHQDCMIAGSYVSHGINQIVSRNKHLGNITNINLITY